MKISLDYRLILFLLLILSFFTWKIFFIFMILALPSLLFFRLLKEKIEIDKKYELLYFMVWIPIMVWITSIFLFTPEIIFLAIFTLLSLIALVYGKAPTIEKKTRKYIIAFAIMAFLFTSHALANGAQDDVGIKYTSLTTAYIDHAYFMSLVERFMITQGYDSPHYAEPVLNYYSVLIPNHAAGFMARYSNVPLYEAVRYIPFFIYFATLVSLFYLFRLKFSRRWAMIAVMITLASIFSMSFYGLASQFEIANISGVTTPFSYELALFKPQAFALLFLTMAMFFFMKIMREPKNIHNYVIFGFLFGTIINSHPITFLIAGVYFYTHYIFIGLIKIKQKEKIYLKNFIIMIAIPAVMGISYVLLSIRVAGTSVIFSPLWWFNYIAWNAEKFLRTFGHVLPLTIIGIIAAYYFIKREKTNDGFTFNLKRKAQKDPMVFAMLWIAIGAFVFPNLFSNGMWHFDRALTYAAPAFAFFAAYGIKVFIDVDKIKSKIAVLIIIVIIAFVYLHNIYIFNATLTPKTFQNQPIYYYFYNQEMDAINWIKENTPQDATFAVDAWHIWRKPSPVTIFSGRKTLFGYGHDTIGSIGGNWSKDVERALYTLKIYNRNNDPSPVLERWGMGLEEIIKVLRNEKLDYAGFTKQDMADILMKNETTAQTLRSLGVQYIYYGVQEKQFYGEPDMPQEDFDHVYDTDVIDIWKVKN